MEIPDSSDPSGEENSPLRMAHLAFEQVSSAWDEAEDQLRYRERAARAQARPPRSAAPPPSVTTDHDAARSATETQR